METKESYSNSAKYIIDKFKMASNYVNAFETINEIDNRTRLFNLYLLISGSTKYSIICYTCEQFATTQLKNPIYEYWNEYELTEFVSKYRDTLPIWITNMADKKIGVPL